MANSNPKKRPRKAASDRPGKPYPDFPLTPHPSGAWQKKILGRIHYFARWGRIVNGKMTRVEGDGWKEALELYKAQADDLHAGRTPRVNRTGDGLKLSELCNRFLTAKLRRMERGKITARTYTECRGTTDLLIAQFGKDRLVDDIVAEDFEVLLATMAKRWGPVRLGNAITNVKSVFNYGYKNGHVEHDPAKRYGTEFVKPDKRELRKHRAKNGERMLEATELRRILDALEGKEVETGRTDKETGKPETVILKANPALRAMILLGVNCGFGNHDCAMLPLTALDLDGGWVNFPRPKTEIRRRCPLWAETVTALRAVIAGHPEPEDESAAKLVFITTRGRPWLSRGIANPVSVAARDAMKAVGIHRDGIGFYTLRHVFRTIGDAALDLVAIRRIMGHTVGGMDEVYTERIDDARLIAVTDHVRKWLFGDRV